MPRTFFSFRTLTIISLLSFFYIGCNRGCTFSREIDREELSIKVGKHDVLISAVKYENRPGIQLFRRHRSREVYYSVSFNVRIDQRPTLTRLGGHTISKGQSLYPLMNEVKVTFSKDDSHVRIRSGYEEQVYHLLPSGTPFTLRSSREGVLPWKDSLMDECPPTREMVSFLLKEEKLRMLDHSSMSGLKEALKDQKAGAEYDRLIVEHMCAYEYGKDHFDRPRIQQAMLDDKWKRVAEAHCRDTQQVMSCSNDQYALLAFASDAGMLRYYDEQFLEMDQAEYVSHRLASKRDSKRFGSLLLKTLKKQVAPYVKTGFTDRSSNHRILFIYALQVKNKKIRSQFVKAVLNTEDFSQITFHLDDCMKNFTLKEEKQVMDAAVASLAREPERRWTIWSFLQRFADCDYLKQVHKDHPEIAKRNQLPYKCRERRGF